MKRYFLIFYAAKHDDNPIYGNISVETDNLYPSHNKMVDIIEEDALRTKGDTIQNTILTNIIELSKDDYTGWGL